MTVLRRLYSVMYSTSVTVPGGLDVLNLEYHNAWTRCLEVVVKAGWFGFIVNDEADMAWELENPT